MARRKKKNVTGLSWSGETKTQVPFYVFMCISPGCDNFVVVESDSITDGAIMSGQVIARCDACHFEYSIENIVKFLESKIEQPKEEIEAVLGEVGFNFDQAASDYLIHFFNVKEKYKYCSICETLKPFHEFHSHKRTVTQRQHECSTCKNRIINSILNPLRTAEQLREGSEGRRLLFITLGKEKKINKTDLLDKFEGVCFKCRKPITPETMRLDHTLPAKLLWPLSYGPTPLCAECNGDKAENWPSQFYSSQELRRLSALTGITYEKLDGEARINPEAITLLKSEMDEVVERGIKKPELIAKLRRLVLSMEGFDVLDYLNKYHKDDILNLFPINEK